MTWKKVGVCVLVTLWALPVWADVLQTLHYSGKLDTAGGAFTGTIEVTFDLYAGAGAKSSFWSETQAVAVQNGRFHAQLGSKTTLTPADVNVANLHLDVTVGTDDEMGKVPIASVPYAFRAIEAANAATVGGQTASSFAASAHAHGYAPLSHTHSYAPEHGHPYVNTGGGTLSGNLAMSSNKVTGLAAPTAAADAATKAYVDAAAGGGGSLGVNDSWTLIQACESWYPTTTCGTFDLDNYDIHEVLLAGAELHDNPKGGQEVESKWYFTYSNVETAPYGPATVIKVQHANAESDPRDGAFLLNHRGIKSGVTQYNPAQLCWFDVNGTTGQVDMKNYDGGGAHCAFAVWVR